MNTVEELLKPRYKVESYYERHYFYSPFRVGDTITQDDTDKNMYWCGDRRYTHRQPDLYPHLFKRLEWQEERNIEDMPEYLVMKHPTQKNVFKASKHFVRAAHGLGFINEFGKAKSYINYLPATEQEYNTYINQK